MNEQSERLPLHNRLLYASGSISGTVISRSMDLFFLFFFAPPADAEIAQRVPIVLAGAVMIRLWGSTRSQQRAIFPARPAGRLEFPCGHV